MVLFRVLKNPYLIQLSFINVISSVFALVTYFLMRGYDTLPVYMYISIVIPFVIWVVNIIYYFNDFKWEIEFYEKHPSIWGYIVMINHIIFGLSIAFWISMIYFMTMSLSGHNMFAYWQYNSVIYIVYFILLLIYLIFDMKLIYKILFYLGLIFAQIYVLINCLTFPVETDNQYMLWCQFFVILVALLCVIRVLKLFHIIYSPNEEEE